MRKIDDGEKERKIYFIIRNVIGCSDQLSLNKFLDASTPSMRKGRDGEMELKTEKIPA